VCTLSNSSHNNIKQNHFINSRNHSQPNLKITNYSTLPNKAYLCVQTNATFYISELNAITDDA